MDCDKLYKMLEGEKEEKKKLIEILADIEHKRWSSWQKYLHSNLTKLNGSLIMSPKYVKHLERQINTPYSKLTENEKDSDIEEVKKTLNALRKNGYTIISKHSNEAELEIMGKFLYYEGD